MMLNSTHKIGLAIAAMGTSVIGLQWCKDAREFRRLKNHLNGVRGDYEELYKQFKALADINAINREEIEQLKFELETLKKRKR